MTRETIQRRLDFAASLSLIVASVFLVRMALVGGFRPPNPTAVRLPALPIVVDENRAMGSASAKVAVLIFSDFQCPYCREFVENTFPKLKQKYVVPGLIRIGFKYYPLPDIHRSAIEAAVAAECAGSQAKFWEMHDLLFADQQHLEHLSLIERASRLGLDEQQFQKCMDGSGRTAVDSAVSTNRDLSLRGTPSFLIGVLQSGVQVRPVDFLSGAKDIAAFSAVIDPILSRAQTGLNQLDRNTGKR